VMVASNDLVLEEGDQINAIVAPEAISEFAKMFAGCSPEAVNA
jgi:Trk K+ transport system NAD-binding subunit